MLVPFIEFGAVFMLFFSVVGDVWLCAYLCLEISGDAVCKLCVGLVQP